jgi:hypothetical protein
MALHLLKMSVGIADIDQLAQVQKRRLKTEGRLCHYTRNMPKRAEEVLDGGSIYWIIRGQIRVRQRLKAIRRHTDPDGWSGCALVLDRKLVATMPRPVRAMQGWRYLEADAAPVDLAVGLGKGDELPPKLVAELRLLGLI